MYYFLFLAVTKNEGYVSAILLKAEILQVTESGEASVTAIANSQGQGKYIDH